MTIDQHRLDQRNRLSRRLVDAVRPEDVAEVIIDAARGMLGAQRAVILAPCAPKEHLHGIRALGTFQEQAEQVVLPLVEDTPWGRAANGELATGRITLGEGTGDALFVPMGPVEDQQVLALVCDGLDTEPLVADLARALADEAWLAFQRAELVAQLEGKVEILEATAAVASVAGLDLDHTLEAVAAHAATALSCERAAVYLRGPDGELALARLHAVDLDVETDAGARTAREVLERGDEVLIQDATTCAFLDGPWHPEIGAVAVFGLPLRVGERDIGVLVVAHTERNPRGFTSLCRQVGASVAQQAALAIEHARLFAAEQDNVRRLEELDQIKADYVAGISHDLRTPLTGLLGFTKTLNRLGPDVDPERLTRYLGMMERQAMRIVAMVEDLLLAARLERGDVAPGSATVVDLGNLLADALDLYAPEQRRRLHIDVHDTVPVAADESQLIRVLHNLIDNALKYAPEETPVEIEVCSVGGQALFVVTDHGPGVGEEEREQIFERFSSGRQGMQRGSTGLGLYISRGIARGHGGDLVYVDREGDGACFELRLPLADGAHDVDN